MDIVLIPCYYRPEFLWLCLEYLSRAEGAYDGKEYWICQDFRHHDNHRYKMQADWTKEVLEKSPLPYRLIQRQPHSYPGNSYNTLEVYKEAYETEARYIYLVEEDVLVTPDFFRWHEAVHASVGARRPYFCSVAYRCSRNGAVDKEVTSPEAYFESSADFASIGVCWPRENLRAVIKHAHSEYYGDMQLYLDTRFPEDRYRGWFSEQDGLIMRVMHEQKGVVAWPYVPRSYHVGNFGYHRPSGRRFDGQLVEKISKVREMIADIDKIKIAAPDFGDIEPVPTKPIDAWSSDMLYCIQRFE